MKVLFICLANLNRSPRAAEVFQKLAEQKNLEVEIQSAGTDASFGLNANKEYLQRSFGVESVSQLTNTMLEEADVVVALDAFVEKEIKYNYRAIPRRIINLKIYDNYSLNRGNLDGLYEILNQKLEPLVEELSLSLKPVNKEAR